MEEKQKQDKINEMQQKYLKEKLNKHQEEIKKYEQQQEEIELLKSKIANMENDKVQNEPLENEATKGNDNVSTNKVRKQININNFNNTAGESSEDIEDVRQNSTYLKLNDYKNILKKILKWSIIITIIIAIIRLMNIVLYLPIPMLKMFIIIDIIVVILILIFKGLELIYKNTPKRIGQYYEGIHRIGIRILFILVELLPIIAYILSPFIRDIDMEDIYLLIFCESLLLILTVLSVLYALLRSKGANIVIRTYLEEFIKATKFSLKILIGIIVLVIVFFLFLFLAYGDDDRYEEGYSDGFLAKFWYW